MVLPLDVTGLDKSLHRNHHAVIHRSIDEQFDIRLYGASTGSPDNTASIQAAIDAAAAVNSAAYVPQGVFKTLSDLYMKSSDSGFVGVGTIDYRGTGYALHFGLTTSVLGSNYRGMRLQGVTFTGTSQALGAVHNYAGTRSIIDRVKIKQFTNGYGVHYHQYGWINSLLQPDIRNCKASVYVSVDAPQDTASQAGNALLIEGGELGAGCQYGVLVGDPAATLQTNPALAMGVTINGASIEGASAWGVYVVDGYNINIQNAYFEANGTSGNGHIRLGNGTVLPAGVSIRDNGFFGNVGVDGFAILVSGAHYLKIEHNQFRHNGTRNTGIKYVLGDFTRVADNFMSDSVLTQYDFPQTGNYVLERMGGLIGYSGRSGSHGWDWQAQASYLHRFYGTDGTIVGEIDRSGAGQFNGGLKLKAPNGTIYTVTVDNSGTLKVT